MRACSLQAVRLRGVRSASHPPIGLGSQFHQVVHHGFQPTIAHLRINSVEVRGIFLAGGAGLKDQETGARPCHRWGDDPLVIRDEGYSQTVRARDRVFELGFNGQFFPAG